MPKRSAGSYLIVSETILRPVKVRQVIGKRVKKKELVRDKLEPVQGVFK
jgi:hypothetical protein